MASQMRNIARVPSHYRKAFRVYAASYDRAKAYGDWVDRVFPAAVVAKLGPLPSHEDTLRMLGVGSGDGMIDCSMLGKLLPSFPRIHNRVVEPNQGYLEQYEKLVDSKGRQLQGADFDWRKQTMEEYENSRDLTRFHFISAVHSMYYMKDLRHSLMHMYDLLEPDGALLFINKTEESGMCRFRRRLKSFFDEHISSADICGIFDREGVPYALHGLPMRADVTECFKAESETGGLLLDFLVQSVGFRETASEELRAEVLEYLGGRDCSEESDDKTLLNIDNEAIVIQKPARG